jgi:hypothetical protein
MVMHKVMKKLLNKIFIFSLILPFLLMAILYNYINIHNSNWFFHPDERDVYVFANQFYEHGNLKIESPAKPLNTSFMTPDGSTQLHGSLLPGRSLGIYILLAPFFIAGSNGPFLAIPFFGFLLLLFVFLISRDVFDKKTAYLATLILGFSPYFILWNNMLFSNIPALMFLLGGIYFLKKKGKALLISPLFFAMSIALRYEYLIYVCLIMLAIVIVEKQAAIKKIIPMLLAIGLFLTPIPLANHALYGRYTSFGYTQKSYDLNAGKTIDYSSASSGGASGQFKKISKRFGGQFNSSMPKNFYTNISEYLLVVAPLLLVLGSLGLLKLNRKLIHEPAILGLIFISIFTLIYFWTAPGYNGFGKSWLVSSYTRYFLPVAVTLAVFSAYALRKILVTRNTLLGCTLAVYAVFSISVSFNSRLGVNSVLAEKKENKKINTIALNLPKNSIIISNFYSKAIINRPVLIPNLTTQNKDNRINKTIQITDNYSSRFKFYIFENNNHSSYLGIAESLKNSNHSLELIDNKRLFYMVQQ